MPDIAALIEKGGLPGLALAAILVAWKMGREGRAEPPEAKIASALETLSGKIDGLKVEMTDRLARVETEIDNLKGRK